MYKEVHVITEKEIPEVEYKYSSTSSLTSALYVLGGQSNPSAAFNRERTGTLCIGGWVGPSFDLDRWVKYHSTGIRSQTDQPVASHYTD